jgi:NADH-ubiquinone oxidoreductase chain 1
LILFFLGPIITLIFSLLGYAVIPFGPGLAISDYNLGILYMLAISSLATYGILLAG